MAITVTPKYKPFTYEELVKPLEGYWKDYDAQEETLQKELTNIAALEPLIYDASIGSNEANAEYIKQYKDYVKSLQDLTNKLHTEGFDRRTQGRDLLAIQKNYRSQMLPLTEALSAMKKAHADENKLRQQGFVLGQGSNNWSISDFYGMNTPGEAAKVSLDSIEKNTEEIAKSLTGAMETKYSIDKKKIINGALQGYTAEKGINALKYASNYDQLSPAELNVIGLIESQVRERILNDLGYTEEEYNSLDSNTKQKINARIHAGLIKGLSYGESITPRRHVSGIGSTGRGERAIPIFTVRNQGTTAAERNTAWVTGVDGIISAHITDITRASGTITSVNFGGHQLLTKSGTVNSIDGISYTQTINSNIPVTISYTDNNGKTQKQVFQIRGGGLTNTSGANAQDSQNDRPRGNNPD